MEPVRSLLGLTPGRGYRWQSAESSATIPRVPSVFMDSISNAVPSRPSVLRVAVIWLTLSIASMAGFASAQPAVEDPPAEASVTADPTGSHSGQVAATAALIRSVTIPTAANRWRSLVTAHFEPLDVNQALRVIHCESSGRPEAINAESGAAGLFQHLPAFWGERSELAGASGPILEPESNVAVAAWLVYEGGGWRHWNASRHCWGSAAGLR